MGVWRDMKECMRCYEAKEDSEFGYHSKRGLQSYCKLCRTAYNKEHYRKNKEVYQESRERWREKIRKKWWKFKSTLKCEICGFNRPECLEFHHPDKNKEFDVGGSWKDKPWAEVMREIAKCIVLCSNCHKILHFQEQALKYRSVV